MELKLVILSLACFSCLVPPALGTSLLAAKAAAVGAGALLAKGALFKGAAVLGAKAAVVKGAAIKGAAALAAKGAAALAAKGAAALAAKGAAIDAVKPSIQVHVPETSIQVNPPQLSKIIERIINLISISKTAALNKTVAVGSLLASLLPTKTIIQSKPSPPKVVLQPMIVNPTIVEAPAKTVQPPVAVIGPTMTVYQ